MSTHLRYMTFSRNNDTLMAPIDISMIDDIIKNAIATGILTNSTQIQTNGILSLIVVYPKVTRGIQRLSGLLQGSLSLQTPLYKLVENREIQSQR